jgi:hypothetical protein
LPREERGIKGDTPKRKRGVQFLNLPFFFFYRSPPFRREDPAFIETVHFRVL